MKKVCLYIWRFVWLICLGISSFNSYAQCDGYDLKVSKATSCAPDIIKFIALGKKPGDHISWDINGDKILDRDTVIKLFLNPEIVDVSLTFSDGTKVCQVVKKGIVKIGQRPDKINVTASPKKLCDGSGNVLFTIKNKGFSEGEWFIEGKKIPYSSDSLNYFFKDDGAKSISLKLKDSLGCMASEKFDDIVTVYQKPSVNFDASTTTEFIPFKTDFTSSFISKDQKAVDFSWTFQGGNSSTSKDENPSGILYKNEGSFDVNLKIETDAGCIYEANKDKYINAGDSIKLKIASNKNNVCPGEVIELYNLSKGPGDFDWLIPGGKALNTGSDTQLVSYKKPGYYDIVLVYRSYENHQIKQFKNFIYVKKLIADFTANKPCGCIVPATVSFQNLTQIPDSGSVAYEWTFYDKKGGKILGKSYKKNPDFVYTKFGDYDVKLVVYHSDGCVDSVYKDDFVKLEKFKNNISLDLVSAGVNQPVQLQFPDGEFCPQDSLSVQWKVINKDTKQVVFTSTEKNPFVTFSDSGNYAVRLKVLTDQGCVATNDSEQVGNTTMGVFNPNPDFTSSAISVCQGDRITLIQNTTPEFFDYEHSYEIINTEDTSIKYAGKGDTFITNIDRPGIYDVKYVASIGTCCHHENYKSDYLKVSGVDADIKLTPIQHCLPYEGRLEADVTKNYHFKNPSETLKYFWSSTPAKGAVFSDPKSKITDVKVTKTGCYTIVLFVTNSDGCTKVIKKKDLICTGVTADFSAPSTQCIESVLKTKNNSSLSPLIFKWSIDRNEYKFVNEDTSSNVKISFQDTGIFNIHLTAIDQHGCTDTAIRKVYVEQVNVDFISSDTLHYCAPAFVDFYALSKKGKKFKWDFGDGEQTNVNKPDISHVYLKNSGGLESGFEVSVEAISEHGCKASITKNNYITIIGPVPSFSTSVTKGCEPLKVGFQNTSTNFSDFYFSYGDVSNVDSNKIDDHIYTVNDSGATSQTYNGVIIVKDSMGCYSLYVDEDGVKVNKKPEADFSVSKYEGCEPLHVSFSDNSYLAKVWTWDADQNGTIDSKRKNADFTFSDGIYYPELVITSPAGCKDTAILKNPITVYDKPEASFGISKEVICPGSSVTFTDQSKSKEKIESWKWDFGIPDIDSDTSDLQNPSPVTYALPGKYNVKLEVVNDKNCKDKLTINKAVEAVKPNKGKPQISYVSHEDGEMEIKWEENHHPLFQSYELFSGVGDTSTPTNLIYNTTDNETVIYDHNQNDDLPFYRLKVTDQCGFVSPESDAHQASYLSVTPMLFSNQLNWTAYKGWKKVSKYEVMRKGPGDDEFQLISTLDGNENRFTDKDICNSEYCYRIVAYNESGNYQSRSNISCGIPLYSDLEPDNILTRSTVSGNAVLTEWKNEKAGQYDFVIDRYNAKDGWQNGYASTGDSSYLDNNADINNENYYYRVRIKDQCGNISEPSNLGSSVLLKTKIKDDKVNLSWTKYKSWEGGVQKYIVQLKNENGEFIKLGELASGDTSFTDAGTHGNLQGGNCYRVIALSQNFDSSFSNTACAVLPSRIYVPNAFSPNKDGINEEFKVVANSIYNLTGNELLEFRMEIYNRWGNLIYKTNDINRGWDGSKDNQPCPEGVYLYQIKAIAMDGQNYFLDGSINLLR